MAAILSNRPNQTKHLHAGLRKECGYQVFQARLRRPSYSLSVRHDYPESGPGRPEPQVSRTEANRVNVEVLS